jgi:hypothetical protein
MGETTPTDLWHFLPVGYLFTVLIETPVLLVGLSPRHSFRRKLFAGVWLNACSYPVVILVLPLVMASTSRGTYLWVAEIFAPVCECTLFYLAFGDRTAGRAAMWRDFATIVLANLASFLGGEVMNSWNLWAYLGM